MVELLLELLRLLCAVQPQRRRLGGGGGELGGCGIALDCAAAADDDDESDDVKRLDPLLPADAWCTSASSLSYNRTETP